LQNSFSQLTLSIYYFPALSNLKHVINFEDKNVLIRPEQVVSTKGKKVVLFSEINSDLFHDKIEKPSKVVSQKKKMVWVPKTSKDIMCESQTSVARTMKSRKPKVTFQQLLAKYEKEEANKGSNRLNYFKHTKSFSRRYFDDYKHWQKMSTRKCHIIQWSICTRNVHLKCQCHMNHIFLVLLFIIRMVLYTDACSIIF
jgi:hypothetical protein